MFRSLSSWLYGGDPFVPLAWQKPLEDIKKRLASGEKIFENAIRGWLLDNRHRAQVLLLPDSGLAARRQEEEEQRLEKARSAMSEAEKLATAEISARLHEAQARPDSPAALATIPTLEPADLPRLIRRLPCAEHPGTVDVLLHELDTTGILYARLLLPLAAVPVDLLPLPQLYARALTEAGTKRHDYVELGLELAARTGGLDAFPSFHTRISDASAADALKTACEASQAVCVSLKKEKKTALPPKLFDLTSLQREANRVYGFTAKQTLDYAQSLYEKRFLTYPRTDSNYLTEDMAQTATDLVAALLPVLPFMQGAELTPEIGRVINSAKVSDHHAIIPTAAFAGNGFDGLPESEKKLMSLVCCKLLCAVAAPQEYETVTAVFDCGGKQFTAKGKTILTAGWKDIDARFRAAL